MTFSLTDPSIAWGQPIPEGRVGSCVMTSSVYITCFVTERRPNVMKPWSGAGLCTKWRRQPRKHETDVCGEEWETSRRIRVSGGLIGYCLVTAAPAVTVHRRDSASYLTFVDLSCWSQPIDGIHGNVSLGAGHISYWLERCGLQNHTCGLFSLKPRCDNSAANC